MSKEAMKLALDALDEFCELGAIIRPLEVRDALREALAEQPAQQEPVAWMKSNATEWSISFFKEDGYVPLYTSPPAQQEPVTWGVDWGQAGQIPCVSIIKRLPGGGIEVVAVEYGPQRTWVGLTDEDKAEIKKQANYNWETTAGEYASKVQALTEAKLKEKNT